MTAPAEITIDDLLRADEDIGDLELHTSLGLTALSLADPTGLVLETAPLSPEDLSALKVQGPNNKGQLKVLRAFHHAIAMKLAAGIRDPEIARQLNISPQTVVRLRTCDDFKSLIDHYVSQNADVHFDIRAQMEAVGMEALSVIGERLVDEEQRSFIKTDDLRKLFTDCVDRVGHSPIRKTESTSRRLYGLTAETLAEVKARYAEDCVAPLHQPSAVGEASADRPLEEAGETILDPETGCYVPEAIHQELGAKPGEGQG